MQWNKEKKQAGDEYESILDKQLKTMFMESVLKGHQGADVIKKNVLGKFARARKRNQVVS